MQSVVSRFLRRAVLAASLGLAVSLPTHAAVNFLPGNNPQPDEENILLNSSSGSFITGTTNSTGLTVLFSSTTDTLLDPPMGQARIDTADGLLNNISIELPGGTYHDFILNLFHGTDTANVSVVTNMGAYLYPFSLGSGQNFLTIIATGGERIVSTTVNSDAGFEDLRQPRISGAALNGTNPPPPVPEPASMALVAAGALPLVSRLRRRQQA